MTTHPTSVSELCEAKLSTLAGVGAQTEAAFLELGVESLWDLVTYFPRRHIDRTNLVAIAEAIPGQDAVLSGTLRSVTTRRGRGQVIVEAVLTDASGSVGLTFFHQPYRARQLQTLEGIVSVSGRVDLYRRRKQMINPVVDPVGNQVGVLLPLYPQRESAGLSSGTIARVVRSFFSQIPRLVDTVPPLVRSDLALMGRLEALYQFHFPEDWATFHNAFRRVAFDELFRLQVVLALLRQSRVDQQQGITHDMSPFTQGSATLISHFLKGLPYVLTGAQQRAIAEIAADMAGAVPMHRLLQGDVGSGKTLVALIAMLGAVQSGYQAALLAPTEVLALQHYGSLKALLANETLREDRAGALFLEAEREVSLALVTGSRSVKDRRVIGERLREKTLDIVVGTHALLSEGIEFANLSLIVVDEQHRFGVEQRALLGDRASDAQGTTPDTLVMTATPIPRTAAMTVYGDLDLSVIDEMPPGRTSIVTSAAVSKEECEAAFALARSEIAKGRQVYVVCPLVDESSVKDTSSVLVEYERVSREEFPDCVVECLHGRMKPTEKEAVMGRFRSGEVAVLVATTVIEVGVDVPNATVMLIEDAHLFGIAQLHQLRGRVGRGRSKSYCVLLGDAQTSVGSARVAALVRHSDGFELAEIDLELRGEGTVFGARQAGRRDLKVASVVRDRELVADAQRHARALLGEDPHLERHPRLMEELSALFQDDEVAYLLKS